jgi:hypothetical protein
MMKADESRKSMNHNALREVDSSRPLCMGHFSSAFELGFRLEPYSLGSFVGRFDKSHPGMRKWNCELEVINLLCAAASGTQMNPCSEAF